MAFLHSLDRKHCGYQAEWPIELERLKEKCGSNSTLKEFRRPVKTIVTQDMEHGHMPDYAVTLVEWAQGVEKVVFTNRRTMHRVSGNAPPPPPLLGEVFDAARQIAPGWDVHMIEAD